MNKKWAIFLLSGFGIIGIITIIDLITPNIRFGSYILRMIGLFSIYNTLKRLIFEGID